jgi:DNA-binding FrmR family transcriptional regulator
MKKGACHCDQLTALKRIEGQVRGVIGMIESERYCVEILNATAAIRGALKRVEAAILKGHLEACVKHALEGRSEKEKAVKLTEICKLFENLRK